MGEVTCGKCMILELKGEIQSEELKAVGGQWVCGTVT